MTQPTLRKTLAASLLVIAALTGPAFAQDTPDRLSEAGTCPAADTMAEPANQPDPSEDATAPENTGTTGWSGGTGGSQLGTNIQGATDSSPTWQPPTARGLDLAGLAEPVAQC
ncbi:hypothetical protein E4L95_23075 [Paracoccus liaowanqingii]|uniref:Uncharacterized protein n=1 Tax=Paracoccus liaowanqingii TaxID=2560053 RepID=A0A4Z1BEP9_9RHOB|nr:hypothetical protein [Paracoccus liaowanqingii]TGN36885.1 hypothetical protein E4L95_23075 [Paracoccus liaowanqingii]